MPAKYKSALKAIVFGRANYDKVCVISLPNTRTMWWRVQDIPPGRFPPRDNLKPARAYLTNSIFDLTFFDNYTTLALELN